MPAPDGSEKTAAPKLGGKLRESRIAFVVGTRPEAIKLSPVARALAGLGEPPLLFVTGQHPGLELANHRLDSFECEALSCPGQPDPTLHADLVRSALKRQLASTRSELLVVMGGTSSALGGALAATEAGVALAHVEAGLRSFDPNLPWPEEENRTTIDRLANLLFAPTQANAANLRREMVKGRVYVTGSSGIDALAELVGALPQRRRWRPFWQPFSLLVTCHHRENWGEGISRVAEAVRYLARKAQTKVILPPNPSVSLQLTECLRQSRNVELVPPLSHRAAVKAMRAAHLILSDSGGMIEEAAALGVPLLILGSKSDRPEVLASGSAMLVGTDANDIIHAVEQLMRNRRALAEMSQPSLPFGGCGASETMAQLCLMFLRQTPAGRRHMFA